MKMFHLYWQMKPHCRKSTRKWFGMQYKECYASKFPQNDSAYLSWACRSLDGFQLGSNMITTLAPVKFSPRLPALVEIKHKEILGSTLNSCTKRVLSAGLVPPSKRLYTSPLLITNSSKIFRSWKWKEKWVFLDWWPGIDGYRYYATLKEHTHGWTVWKGYPKFFKFVVCNPC